MSRLVNNIDVLKYIVPTYIYIYFWEVKFFPVSKKNREWYVRGHKNSDEVMDP